MAIGVVANITVAEGKNAEFEKVFLDLIEQVRANEPGNNFYALHKSRADDTVYFVLEQYADEDALKAHGESEHFKTIGAKMGGCMAGRPEVEYMDSCG